MNINPSILALTLKWRGDGIALLGGILIPWAFAPYSISSLAFISVVLLMFSWANCSPARAFWRGWLYGIPLFGIGVSWVHISMHQFGGVSTTLSIILTLLFVAFLALFPAITGYIAKWLTRHLTLKLTLILVIPAAWALIEWFRSQIFTGFPWLSLGYSQLDTPLMGLAPLIGVFGVSYFIVLMGGLILYGLLAPQLQNVKYILASLILVLGGSGLLQQIDWSKPIDDEITISLIQGNMSQDKKWLAEQRQPTLDLYAKLSRQYWTSDLVIWPETAVPAVYHTVKPFLQSLAQEARLNSSELLLGIPVYDQRAKKYFNSMISLGLHEGSYDKQHLVPFGEYLPLAFILRPVITFFNIPLSDFTAGEREKPILTVAGQKVGISICYEDAFGEEIAMALPDATFLINASNDAWFGDSIAPHQHLEIARMRAIETSRFLLRSTNTGISAIINNKGEMTATSPQFEVHVLTGKVQPLTGMTPYSIFTNISIVTFAILSLCMAGWFNHRQKRAIKN